MRKSRSDTARTRKRIVSTASKMFLSEGVAHVGTRDIMAAASMTQGGFYRHFKSREQLVAEANDAAFDLLLTMLEGEIAGNSPAEAVEKIVSLYLNQSQNKKRLYLCPLAILGAELSHGDSNVRAVAVRGYQRLVQLLADSLKPLVASGAHELASGIVSTMVGAVTLANIDPDPVTAHAILRNSHSTIQALLAHSEKGS
jgi:TetR/AcrR family transcriptional repressor of nem operon